MYNKLIFIISLCFISVISPGGTKPELIEKFDWRTFLFRHDLIWERSPDDYFTAPFIGNGLLGALVYQPQGEPLRMDIGRTDVVDHRDTEARSIVDNGRLPIGHFTFETNGSLQNLSGRLNLYDAVATHFLPAFTISS